MTWHDWQNGVRGSKLVRAIEISQGMRVPPRSTFCCGLELSLRVPTIMIAEFGRQQGQTSNLFGIRNNLQRYIVFTRLESRLAKNGGSERLWIASNRLATVST